MTQRLALASARHPWRTVTAWIAAVIVSIGLIRWVPRRRAERRGRVAEQPGVAAGIDLIEERDFQQLSQDDLKTGELQFGLPAALIVLLLVFGAVVAGLIPLALALFAITTALGLTALVGIAFDLSIFTVNMLTGMALALGIDYSLFVVSRFREERSGGREKLDAIGATGSTASRAVLFSGIAFVIAMFGLLIIPSCSVSA